MISPRAFELVICHLDAIDKAVSKRVARRRPWNELALTALLCDLLDDDSQEDIVVQYSVSQLNQDLSELDGLLTWTAEVETIQYPTEYERWVNQSDLGLVVTFRDELLPTNCWTKAFLLQAKRLYLTQPDANKFDEASRFLAHNSQQHDRIQRLHKQLGYNIVSYLLYCPRPSLLDPLTGQKLRHLRNLSLVGDIFDYTSGLFLREEIDAADSSLAAGIFVADPQALPQNLGEVHSGVMKRSTPLSWFIATLFLDSPQSHMTGRHQHGSADSVQRLVRGETDAVRQLLQQLDEDDAPSDVGPLLPGHVLTIGLTVGIDAPPDLRRIHLQD